MKNKMSKWKSISTAPRDGTYILAHLGMSDVLPEIVFWNKKKGWWFGEGDYSSRGTFYTPFKPTHWMPLPKPPETK